MSVGIEWEEGRRWGGVGWEWMEQTPQHNLKINYKKQPQMACGLCYSTVLRKHLAMVGVNFRFKRGFSLKGVSVLV